MVVEMKSSSEGEHSFRREARYCRRAAAPIDERLANSLRELWAGSKARPWEKGSECQMGRARSRGDGAGVGGEAIGTYRVDELSAIEEDG